MSREARLLAGAAWSELRTDVRLGRGCPLAGPAAGPAPVPDMAAPGRACICGARLRCSSWTGPGCRSRACAGTLPVTPPGCLPLEATPPQSQEQGAVCISDMAGRPRGRCRSLSGT